MKSCPLCRNTYPVDYQTCPLDQAVLIAASNEIAVGTVLRGKYEVLAQLGAGGMASVYKVRHKAFQEIAAIKVVHQHLVHDPGFVKRFRNEAVVARQLKHPNAVRIDDFDYTEDGRPFIVMEYVQGRSLYEARKEFGGPWPPEQCIRIAAQAASALGAAHTLGIVHRDIKPSNILLTRAPDGGVHVKVLDFGIAKVSENPFAGMTSVSTQQSLIIGTPEYMSPEQASGRLETALDGRSDIYSLGLVLYELLTGAHPFKADTPMGMLIQQLNTQPAPPESIHAVPPAISALVLKSLHKEPSGRFQSAADLLNALRDPQAWFATQLPAPAPPQPPASLMDAQHVAAHQAREVEGQRLCEIADRQDAEVTRRQCEETNRQARQQEPQDPQHADKPVQAPPRFGSNLSESQQAPLWRQRNKGKATVAIAATTILLAIALVYAMKSNSSDASSSAAGQLSRPSVSRPAPAATTTMSAPPATANPQSPTAYDQARSAYAHKQYTQARKQLAQVCDAGEMRACSYLGYLYAQGLGGPANAEKAASVYLKACNAGNMVSCASLGSLFQDAEQTSEANKYFKQACDGGLADGCKLLRGTK